MGHVVRRVAESIGCHHAEVSLLLGTTDLTNFGINIWDPDACSVRDMGLYDGCQLTYVKQPTWRIGVRGRGRTGDPVYVQIATRATLAELLMPLMPHERRWLIADAGREFVVSFNGHRLDIAESVSESLHDGAVICVHPRLNLLLMS